MSQRRRNLSLQIQRTLKGRGECAVRIHRRRSCRGSRRRRNRLDRRLPRPRGSRSSRRRCTTCNRRRSRVAPAISTASIQGAVVDVVRTPREPRRLARDRVDLLQPIGRRRPQHPPRRRRLGRTPRTRTPTLRVSLRRRRAAYVSFLGQLGTPPGPDRVPFEPPSDRLARTEIARHRARRVFALKGRRSPRVVQSRGCRKGVSADRKAKVKRHPANSPRSCVVPAGGGPVTIHPPSIGARNFRMNGHGPVCRYGQTTCMYRKAVSVLSRSTSRSTPRDLCGHKRQLFELAKKPT